MVAGGRHRPLLLLAAALLAGGVALVALGRGWWAEDEPPLTGPPVSVQTSISPSVHLFGDPVAGRIELLADRRRVDLRTLRLDTDFYPYRALSSVRKTQVDVGDTAHITYSFRLWCPTRECLPERTSREFELRPLRVVYLLRGPPGRTYHDRLALRRFADVSWPSLQVASRLVAADLGEWRWRTGLDPLPAVSYRVGPDVLVGTLLGASFLLLLVAVVLLAALARRGRAVRDGEQVERAPQLSPLERALALVREAADGRVGEERKALEGLARELARRDKPKLAGDARRLAWSQSAPAPVAVDALASEVSELLREER